MTPAKAATRSCLATRTIGVWAETAQQGAVLLGADTPAGARLRRTSQFFELMQHDMALAAEHYRLTLHNT